MNLTSQLISLLQNGRLPGGFSPIESDEWPSWLGLLRLERFRAPPDRKSRSSVKRKLNWPFAWPPKVKGMINNVFTPSPSR